MAIPTQGDGGAAGPGHPYRLQGVVPTFRVNNDGTFTQVVNITATSVTYGVAFTFTITEATYKADGAKTQAELRTEWVDTVCAHPHVIGFRTEVDQGPDQVLYNYAVITVGTDDGAITGEARVRMDQLNTPAAFGAIDKEWSLLVNLGAS